MKTNHDVSKLDVSKLENHLPEKKIELGENTGTTLHTITSDKQKLPVLAMKKFYPYSSGIFPKKVANKL